MAVSEIGLIGLGTMGRNLLLNIADKGFNISGFDIDQNQRTRLIDERHEKVDVFEDLPLFISSLTVPRKIIILVPAGKIVDQIISEFRPFLANGDIIIDGGNSHFADTEKRFIELKKEGIHFMGMGVSGGEEGARNGPSLMPGSDKVAYEKVKPILQGIAAQVNDLPCVEYIGNGAAGHYTKMVHNGIEYAMMQMISEVYGLMKAAGLSNDDLHYFFKNCNETELKGYLIEITAAIFTKKDDLGEGYLIDKILDKAGQKGTGMWMSQSALELGVCTNIIDTAVNMRTISSQKDLRNKLNSQMHRDLNEEHRYDANSLLLNSYDALYAGFLLSYAQGLNLLQVASIKYGFNIEIENVLQVWKGGCIIRSEMLGLFQQIYEDQKNLINPITSLHFQMELNKRTEKMKAFIQSGFTHDIALPSFSAAYQYFLAYSTAELPTNLIQAQRDYFGAHTFQRRDIDGVFHSQWK